LTGIIYDRLLGTFKITDMATVYKIELVSDWIAYSEKELEQLIKDTLIKNEKERGNTVTVRIKRE
jgi:hypothetical protein